MSALGWVHANIWLGQKQFLHRNHYHKRTMLTLGVLLSILGVCLSKRIVTDSTYWRASPGAELPCCVLASLVPGNSCVVCGPTLTFCAVGVWGRVFDPCRKRGAGNKTTHSVKPHVIQSASSLVTAWLLGAKLNKIGGGGGGGLGSLGREYSGTSLIRTPLG